MWTVYSDNNLLYHPQLDEYKILDPALALELNKTGSFNFAIYPQHIHYADINKLKSIITVYKDDELYFRGRVLNDTVGWHNEREITCEGELAFLVDSIQRPFNFPESEDDEATPAAYFAFLINRHNEQVDEDKQFVVGTCTVTDPNNYIARSDTEYSTTWDLLNEGLIDTLGGYLWVDSDTATGKRRINYLADFDVLGNQPIEFAKNLLNISTERKGEDIATAIIPLGAKDEDTDDRLTISSLADETSGDIVKSGDSIYSISGVGKYGYIAKPVIWDDVTSASNLLTKAKAELGISILQPLTTTLGAADLSAAGYDFDTFALGTKIQVKDTPHSESHDLSSTYLIKKLSIRLDNPAQNTLTVGDTKLSYTESNMKHQATQWQQVQTNITETRDEVIRETDRRTQSVIQQNSETILSQVQENYYQRDETDALISSVSTQLEQTSNSFEFKFNEFNQALHDFENSTAGQFTDISKYIRFENGNIILGVVGNEITLVQQNDRISFFQNGAEVAYLSNNKLYVTDAEILGSLRIGKFAFIPRANGNMSLKKVAS